MIYIILSLSLIMAIYLVVILEIYIDKKDNKYYKINRDIYRCDDNRDDCGELKRPHDWRDLL